MGARDRLVETAERLIAERGLQVPLRDIAVAAGQRNNSAVQYHFGTRDGLVEAVIRRRMLAMEAHRLDLLVEHETSGGQDDVATLIGLLVRPLVEVPYAEGATHYARFLEQARTHPLLSGRMFVGGDEWRATRIVLGRLDRALDLALEHPPADVRRRRLRAMATLEYALLADRERALEAGDHAAVLDLEEIVAMLAALLTAPLPTHQKAGR